jgi:glycosyltransferase involved in cell wall biosynthesis
VIATVLDERHTIERLLEGVIVQLREQDELVVVDGGSRDGTYELLLEYAGREPRVNVLRAPGSNIAAGRNLAVSVARNNVIACTDAGCRVCADWLERLTGPFAAGAEAAGPESDREVPGLAAGAGAGVPGLAAGVPRVLARGALQRAQSLACYADPNEGSNPTLHVRLYGRLFGGVFDPSLPFARSLAFTRQAWHDAGGFPERLRWVEDGVFGRAVAAHHRCVVAEDADVYWEQRRSVSATFKMYYQYGIGAAESGDRQLQGRDGLRMAGYLLAAPMLACRDRRVTVLTLGAGAAYYSLPLLRTVRYRAGVSTALCIPLALAIKDLGKIAGAASVHLSRRRGVSTPPAPHTPTPGRARSRVCDAAGTQPGHDAFVGKAPVRLMFVTPDLRVGGAERHLVTLAGALDRARFTTTVICLKELGPLADDLAAEGIEVHCLHTGERKLAMLDAIRRLVFQMRARRTEIVITHGLSANVLGRLAAAIARVPARITWKHNCGHLGHHGLLERGSERVLGPLCTRYIGVAHGQVPYLLGYLHLTPEKVRVIHNSVDPARYPRLEELADRRRDLGFGERDRVIAVSAVLRREKDHATILRAIHHLVRRVPGVRLLLIGDGPERARLQRLAAELGIEERVMFLGSRVDVAELLACANVVALASHTVECFPYAILEAMAMRRPAVCTAVGGLAEMIEDGVTGYLVPPRDPEALAEALGRVLTSEDRGHAMGEAARRRLEKRFPFSGMLNAAERELVAALDGDRAMHNGEQRG